MTTNTAFGQTKIYRGATIQFATNFFDFNGEITQPSGALVNIKYQTPTPGVEATTSVEMSPPAGAETRWTAVWDTRNVGPGLVYWSIHTEGAIVPYAVEDGRFNIEANAANVPTF